MNQDIDRILIYQSDIQQRIGELADHIAELYSDGLVIVPIMSGAMIFVSDLIRYLPMKMKIDLITVTSYHGTMSSNPIIRQDIETSVEGKDVLVIDDILDTGKTLSLVARRLASRKPAGVRTCVLLNRKKNEQQADLSGFYIEDEFVVGYGLDYNGYYRNYPHIAVLKPELYQEKVHVES